MAPIYSEVSRRKVVFVLGATGTGKSKLSIALATSFAGEIINSDKIQVYNAIPVITNRISEEELSAAPHHLLAFLPPDADFHAGDFIRHSIYSIMYIASRQHLPIIAGGSNSYIEALVSDPIYRAGHESCFIWLSVDPDILDRFVSARVDTMMQQGLLEEARSLFNLENSDYSRGAKRAIGVPELDEYFRATLAGCSEEDSEKMLKEVVENVKANTCKLIRSQVEKIRRFTKLQGWNIQQVDASEFLRSKLTGTLSDYEEAALWESAVGVPCRHIVTAFLLDGKAQ